MTAARERSVFALAVCFGALGTIMFQKGTDAVLAQARPQPAQTRPQPPAAAARDGRFQIIFNPRGLRADTFLLDTQTGKIWRPTQFTDLEGDPSVWHFEDRVDSREDLLTWSAGYRKKEKKAKP
jgi:hypothetical protein